MTQVSGAAGQKQAYKPSVIHKAKDSRRDSGPVEYTERKIAENNKLGLLNKMLKNSDLKLPAFRCSVESSGSNLVWLRKNLTKNPKASKELIELLNLDMCELLKSV